jgi:sugar phosphate isomerase/epimerase
MCRQADRTISGPLTRDQVADGWYGASKVGRLYPGCSPGFCLRGVGASSPPSRFLSETSQSDTAQTTPHMEWRLLSEASVRKPRLSISECTTFPSTFETDLEAYRGAGVEGIGIWEFKLPQNADERSLDLLQASGLEASICVPEVASIYPDSYFTEPGDPDERRDALCSAIRRLARFRPTVVMAVTGDPTGRDINEMRRKTVGGLRVAADVAGELGLILGIEGYRASSGSLVSTIPGMLALADEIDRPNVKIIPDTWHIWDDPGMLDDLRLNTKRFAGVQICDWRDPTRSWADRVMPGDGVIDWSAVFGALETGGYDGWVDLEIFSDDGRFGNAWPDSIWTRPPEDVAAQAVADFDRLWETRTMVR